jgi:NAD(P)-dependent dehydrogenase (short-subunit alcohol dehydrogenase family)
MDLGLAGKVALITGASRGLGKAIAIELAREGADLSLAARDEAKLNEVAAAITAQSHVGILICGGDFRLPETVKDTVAKTVARFGRIDILVNNAGAAKHGDFFELCDEDWQDSFALKFYGYVRATRESWPHLKKAKGCIINIVGIGSRLGSADYTIGGSINVALLNFTKAMSEIGIADGVRVNAINPGYIATDRVKRGLERMVSKEHISLEDAAVRRLAALRIERFGRPEEIAAFTAFLASDQASFTQGAIIDVDGGQNRAL